MVCQANAVLAASCKARVGLEQVAPSALAPCVCIQLASAASAWQSQRFFGSVAHCLVDFAAVPKAHFDFGGVHVHIHARWVHV